MSQQNVDFIRALYEAFAKGDIPAVLGDFDPNIRFILADNSPYAANSPHIGPTAVLENVFMRIGAEWNNFAIRVDELIDAGEKVIMLGYYTGTYKATGKQILAQVAHIWTSEGGKAIKFQQYTDTKQLAEAAGSLIAS
jgi:ketosteroid isomerase-like protein